MSARNLFAVRNHRLNLRVASLFLSLCLLGSLQANGSSACWSDPEAVPLRAEEAWSGTTWRGVQCFVVDSEESGILAVEIVQPAAATRLFLESMDSDVDSGAASSAAGGFEILRRTGSVLLARVPEGRLGLRVVSADRRPARVPFRLQTGFVAEPRHKGEYDGEIEIEPENFSGCSLAKGEYDGEIEIEPENLSGCSLAKNLVTPPIPSADLTQISELAPERLDALCAGLEGSLLCADRLDWGVTTRDALGVARIDPARVYRFDVPAVGSVAIRAQSWGRSDDLAIELLDRSGQRLDAWSTAGRVSARAVVLVPGTYFVRVQSGGSAHYELVFGSLLVD